MRGFPSAAAPPPNPFPIVPLLLSRVLVAGVWRGGGSSWHDDGTGAAGVGAEGSVV